MAEQAAATGGALPDCPCGKGKWEFDLMQKQLAAELDVTDAYLRHRKVKRQLDRAKAVQDGQYARCTVCGVRFYRTEFGIGIRKGVKREKRK